MDPQAPFGLDFAFITDSDFRAAIESDYGEMCRCADQQAWKAVHVLAGSIIEALLVEYLLERHESVKGDPLAMSLGDLISSCRDVGLLDTRTVELSSVLRSYRNLIHPGRVLRLGERIDLDGAQVAQSLVRMIVRSIEASQRKAYGLTAEQIVRKLSTDSTALGVVEHLLRDVRPREIERLLTEVLPTAYFESADEEWRDESLLLGFARLFRIAMEMSTDVVKHRVMKGYVKVLREESGRYVRVHETQFFRASNIEFVAEPDRRLVIDHLLARMKDDPSEEVFDVARGLSGFLEAGDASPFSDPLIRMLSRAPDDPVRVKALRVLEAEYGAMTGGLKKAVELRLGAWLSMYRSSDRFEDAETVQRILDSYDDIPF